MEKNIRLPNWQLRPTSQFRQKNEFDNNLSNYLDDVADCYSFVFRGPPWNEAYVDDNGKFYGPEYDPIWEEMGLSPAYPAEQTKQYIQTELAYPNSKLIIKSPPNSNQVIGFGWGYEFPNTPNLVNSKWPSISEFDQSTLTRSITSITGQKKIWYLSEVGILPDFQNQGLGTSIVSELITNIRLPIIMRTNNDSPMTYIAQKTGFTKFTDFTDPVNPNRVLYYKKGNL